MSVRVGFRFVSEAREIMNDYEKHRLVDEQQEREHNESYSRPELIGSRLVSVQVCVPDNWSNDQVIDFVQRMPVSWEKEAWEVRKDGDVLLCGHPAKTPCKKKPGYIHMFLDLE